MLHRMHCLAAVIFLLLYPLLLRTPVFAQWKLDFEDKPADTYIQKHYLNTHGVEFVSASICQPKGTHSGTRALCEGARAAEFSPSPMTIRFAATQSYVRFYAGPNVIGNPMPYTITATAKAYNTSGQVLSTVVKALAAGSTGINNYFSFTSTTKAIREVRLEYSTANFEVIDDLEFSDKGLAIIDQSPPVVTINTPLNNSTVMGAWVTISGKVQENVGLLDLRFTLAPDYGAGWDFLYTNLVQNFPMPFGVNNVSLSYGKNKITVTATDISGNKGSASVIVYAKQVSSGLRKLGVYSLTRYENNWKSAVPVTYEYDPYGRFWDFMTKGAGSSTVDVAASQRFKDSQVTHKTVIPIPQVSTASWDDFDMVYFFGHNNMITGAVSRLPSIPFECYRYSGNQWISAGDCDLSTTGWGTPARPFDYWAKRPITNAAQYPAALTYLYNKYTSCLLGAPYDYGNGEPDGTAIPYRLQWFDAPKAIVYSKLGAKNLKWLVLHGCQAVINADADGNWVDIAYRALGKVHGGYHIILGHRRSYTTGELKPMEGFAMDLICGVPIQTAYFDAKSDPDDNSSAIAAEHTGFSWANSTMVNDRWTQPVKVPAKATVFSERWIVSGGVRQQP